MQRIKGKIHTAEQLDKCTFDGLCMNNEKKSVSLILQVNDAFGRCFSNCFPAWVM